MGKKDVKQPQQTPPVRTLTAQAPKVSFDVWWATTAKKLATHHRKEIVMADFKARGLSTQETMVAYDKALQLYGVKFN